MERSMIRISAAVFLCLMSFGAVADRITELDPTERCVYTAKLYVAGYYYYLQGKSRQEIKIHWHGDETQNEIDFVTRTLDAAYARVETIKREHPEMFLSELTFGDQAYLACMSGTEL
jgi:hypothetical protein